MDGMIIKFGGSVITNKRGYKEVDPEVIKRLSQIVGKFWENWKGRLILINGAGSFGHAVVKNYDLVGKIEENKLLGFADVYNSCNYLSTIVCSELIKQGVPAVFLPPLFFITQKNGKVVEFNSKAFKSLLTEGLLPVSGGNMVNDLVLGKSIVSGDRIIFELVRELDLPTVAFGTDVDGILDNKGEVIPHITREDFTEIRKYLTTKEGDYTGAMLGKVETIFQMGRGKKVYVFNLKNFTQLEELLRDGKIKTGKFTLIET
jgi:isopentenyl phosphate kinase